MKTITFHCEVITPMFLAGADGKKPELRPPSIKGAMRFWWRAMNGHLVTKKDGKWDYSKLKEEEAKIFGGKYKDKYNKEVLLKSNVDIIINYNKKDIIYKNNYKEDNDLITSFDNETGGLSGQDIGVSYLLYSAIVNNRKYIAEGSKFSISFNLRNPIIVDSVTKSFWLLTFFGGIGTRVRRGAGAFFVYSIEGEFDIKSWFELQQKTTDYQNFYSEKFNSLVANSNSESNFYSTISTNSLYIGNNKGIRNNSKTALNRIGKLYYEYRTANRGSQYLAKKGNFGLPIMSLATNEEIQPENKERRSSPIYLSIFPLLEKKKIRYLWSTVHLKGFFLEDNESILRLKKNGNTKTQIESQLPNEQYIKSFLNSLNS